MTRLSPSQIINQHVDLVRRLDENPKFADWLWVARDRRAKDWPLVRAATVEAAGNAECYRVSGDMSLFVQGVASQLTEEDVWDPELAPAPAGLVHMDEPMMLQQGPDLTRRVDWILWGPTEDGRTISLFFNDLNDVDDGYRPVVAKTEQEGLDLIGRWGPIALAVADTGCPLSYSRTPSAQEVGQALTNGVPLVRHSDAGKYLHALWLMMGQKISDVAPDHLRRTVVKEAVRQGVRTPKVTVVQMRRSSEAHRRNGESTVEWTRRWMVKGHLRWQPFGEGLQQRRRIVIAPHVKGPQDKPLVISTKVYDLKQ